MSRILFMLLLIPLPTQAADTLFTHPLYPPLVYQGDEYNFYKYTPRYVPENLLHCFKILGTHDKKMLDRFVKRSEAEVVERGIFDRGYRLRKEFCLEGYAPFIHYFHRQGIYFPHAMQTYILLGFHQYLLGERIHWHHNKTISLTGFHRENNAWKKRAKYLFKSQKKDIEVIESGTEETDEDVFFQW